MASDTKPSCQGHHLIPTEMELGCDALCKKPKDIFSFFEQPDVVALVAIKGTPLSLRRVDRLAESIPDFQVYRMMGVVKFIHHGKWFVFDEGDTVRLIEGDDPSLVPELRNGWTRTDLETRFQAKDNGSDKHYVLTLHTGRSGWKFKVNWSFSYEELCNTVWYEALNGYSTVSILTGVLTRQTDKQEKSCSSPLGTVEYQS